MKSRTFNFGPHFKVLFCVATLSNARLGTSNAAAKAWNLEDPYQSSKANNPSVSNDVHSEIITERDEQNSTIKSFGSSQLVPDSYKVIVFVDNEHAVISEENVKEMKLSVAEQLVLPEKNIVISNVDTNTGIIEFYAVYTLSDAPAVTQESLPILLPADEVVKKISGKDLQHAVGALHIRKLQAKSLKKTITLTTSMKKFTAWQIFKNQIWSSWHLPIMICASLFIIFAMVVVLMILCYRFKEKQKTFKAIKEARQVLYQPVLKPSIKEANFVQPESRNRILSEFETEKAPSPCRSPLHIRTKGLLERRGSNASLTLDLSYCSENTPPSKSPKSYSAEEILMSAGNRMNRKQLRNCLKNVKALHTEFWEIPMNHVERTEIPGSGTKNRYKTILPNEHSRVKLEEINDDPLTAYINANYIRGYEHEEKVFIATQGPMAHTVCDFWRMIWQEKAPAIVMITKLREKNKVKCESYLSESHGYFEDMEVRILRVLPCDGYTIRELILKKGEESHKLFHFWYTAWPDHKTPSTAKQLLSMALELESMQQKSKSARKSSVVVHCSAGIGRTGCFIAVATGMRQLLEENMVDILGIVCALRLDRGGMVQTAEQYEFVHQALNLFEQALPNLPGD